jgi:hypothetical protein
MVSATSTGRFFSLLPIFCDFAKTGFGRSFCGSTPALDADSSHFLPGFFDFAKTAFRVLLRAHAGEWQPPAALE